MPRPLNFPSGIRSCSIELGTDGRRLMCRSLVNSAICETFNMAVEKHWTLLVFSGMSAP